MENNEIDKKLLRDLFDKVRSAEIKNVKIQKLDDKEMAKTIYKFLKKKLGGDVE